MSRYISQTHRSLVIALVVGALILTTAPLNAQSAAGQIAIAGADGNIHLYDIATETLTTITDDAMPNAIVYAWPTWASDGELAYFGTNFISDPAYRLGIFIKPPSSSSRLVYSSTSEVFTYAFWSPGDCPAGNCRDLAVLYTQQSGNLAVRNVRSLNLGTDVEISEVAVGGPFYWDWAPDGSAMFWARFGQRLEIYDVASEAVVLELDEQQGIQRAVDWSPVDNRLLTTVRSNGAASDLVVIKGQERFVLAEGIRAGLAFEWSPDGNQVAYVDTNRGALTVVDAITGNVVAMPDERVLAFFWSPDGQHIAYLTVTVLDDATAARIDPRQSGLPVLVWNVYDMAADTHSRLASFLPSSDMLYYLRFYDQFARSHRLWSPDSRYLVYGALQDDGRSEVHLLDTTAPGSAPQVIADGQIGIFSWE